MRGRVEREHRIGDLSPRATPPREFPESDGGGACTPHVMPAASARCPPDPEYITPRREIGIPGGVGPCQGDVRVGPWWFVVVGVLGASVRRGRGRGQGWPEASPEGLGLDAGEERRRLELRL
jgi:hypothetical protein